MIPDVAFLDGLLGSTLAAVDVKGSSVWSHVTKPERCEACAFYLDAEFHVRLKSMVGTSGLTKS